MRASSRTLWSSPTPVVCLSHHPPRATLGDHPQPASTDIYIYIYLIITSGIASRYTGAWTVYLPFSAKELWETPGFSGEERIA